MCEFVVQLMVHSCAEITKPLRDKNEKRRVVKGYIYLDALITLQRMPNKFAFSMDQLSQRFHHLPKETLTRIFERFC